jgi:hypothetical protein
LKGINHGKLFIWWLKEGQGSKTFVSINLKVCLCVRVTLIFVPFVIAASHHANDITDIDRAKLDMKSARDKLMRYQKKVAHCATASKRLISDVEHIHLPFNYSNTLHSLTRRQRS